jgi:uncharacterized protein (DUF1501 family)
VERNELAVVHACGSPNGSRSHFDMQDFMEAGVAGDKSVTSGWANRLLSANGGGGGGRDGGARRSPFRAVAMGRQRPPHAAGRRRRAGDPRPEHLRPPRRGGVPRLAGAGSSGASGRPTTSPADAPSSGFEGLYAAAVDDALGATGRESFDAIAMLKAADPARYKPAGGAKYPGTPLGRSLLQVAQLVKADLGVEVAFVEDEGGTRTRTRAGRSGSWPAS